MLESPEAAQIPIIGILLQFCHLCVRWWYCWDSFFSIYGPMESEKIQARILLQFSHLSCLWGGTADTASLSVAPIDPCSNGHHAPQIFPILWFTCDPACVSVSIMVSTVCSHDHWPPHHVGKSKSYSVFFIRWAILRESLKQWIHLKIKCCCEAWRKVQTWAV